MTTDDQLGGVAPEHDPGVDREDLPELRWGHTPDSRGTISKNQDWRGGMDKWRDTTGHRAANATPLEFRDELLRLAMKAHNAEITDSPKATLLDCPR